jgi:hypothetical protein
VSRCSVRLVGLARARRLARRLGRRLVTPILAVVVVALVKGVAGTVVAAVAGGVALTVGVVWWWARVVEPRLFAPRTPRPSSQLVRPVTQSQPSPSEGERHLMFAQALAYVATRYLAECEQELGSDREARR